MIRIIGEKIDEQNNCRYYLEKGHSGLFTIPYDTRKQYSYIRIRNTGPNASGSKFLMLAEVEFNGHLS